MEVFEMPKNKVAKVKVGEFDAEKYNLSTNEAYLMLKERGLTKADNEQVVQRWLKAGKIDAVLVKKGPQKERGYQINEASLLEYTETQAKKSSEWKQELEAAHLKIASLEAQIQTLLGKEIKLESKAEAEVKIKQPKKVSEKAPANGEPKIKKRIKPIKPVEEQALTTTEE
jgi:hypothetical protein